MATERMGTGAGRVRAGATSTTPDQWQDTPAKIDSPGAIIDNESPHGASATKATSPTASENDAGNIGVAAAASARGLMDSAREGAQRQLTTQKDRAVSGLSSLVGARRDSGRQLKEKDSGIASFTDGAANQLERLVEGLRTQDVRTMGTDLGRFARRRPGVFVGAAFLAGLAAARFLKSSADDASAGTQEFRSHSARTPAVSPQQPRGGTYGQGG
jgi:hypothetical protein